jgi:hypothetical protein
MLGIVGSPEEQLVWNRRALEFAERSTGPRTRRWRASITHNQGWTFFEAGDYAAALDLLGNTSPVPTRRPER